MGRLILSMRDLTKAFPGVLALNKASLNVYEGEAMALLGENGAGKSTMMKVLTGVYQKDGGTITFLDREIEFKNARQAQEGGVAIIHQELNLVPKLRVYETVFLGRELTGRFGTDRRGMIEKTRELLALVRVRIDPRQQVGELSIAQQQMVEIAKALLLDAKVIVMDEPTDALPDEEVESLFAVIRQLKAQGKAIVYISHRLEEVFRICERATVLRDGEFIAEVPVSELDMDGLIRMLVGRPLDQHFPYTRGEGADVALRVRGLTNAHVKDISFELKKGEVLGVTGLVGAGRTELAQTLYGLYPWDAGEAELLGKPYKPENPRQAIARGLYYMTEDRKRNGLVMTMDVKQNITLSSLRALLRRGAIDARREREAAGNYIQKMRIKTPGMRQRAKNLSGGNQQKVVLSKALMTEPEVLILDEPTRGIDVGAKKEIYHLIGDLKERGKAVLMISSEMPEVLGMSDRVMVLHGGRKMGELDRAEATQERIMELILGAARAPRTEDVG
ncbi:MAG TPA: sugar ABC transporter ATP-binding protein [Candidatus Limnocylindria bacterium]|nr:sugar ABC transporter ATP-binding protein [Candidatus Limnocylindria bacterium]